MSQAKVIPDVLTLDEAADYLRISRESVERLAPLGQIPGRRIEGEWRFSRLALDKWLQGGCGAVRTREGQRKAPAEYTKRLVLRVRKALAESGKPVDRYLYLAVQGRERRKRAKTSREKMIEQAGRLADDPTLVPMLDEIYRKRGRPESGREPS